MSSKAEIQELIKSSISLKQEVLADEGMTNTVNAVVDLFVSTFEREGKVLFCGNGGSAADAQHIAAELSGRFYIDREPLFAEALHVNTSYLTATANDHGYDEVYARLVQAMGRQGDILVGLSTSGNSPNVVKAMETGRDLGMITIGFTGSKVGEMDIHCDHLIKVPSADTPRIQEVHMLFGHIICQLVEAKLFA